ncbi:MAG: serine hydrolase [Theionarchaea archaeon]|nr:serine hydrolase [Theionarchaea archaeon]
MIEMESLSPESKEKFETVITTAMAQAHVPGMSIAAVKDNHVVYAQGFGARNLKDNLPATPDTLYGIGSCTKSFTALAVMQLVEQGKVNVTDPVSNYVPFSLGTEENPITIHHLLTHSSGIPNLGIAEILIPRLAGEEEHYIPMGSSTDLLIHINGAKKEVVTPPGKRFFYFNGGYTLLAEIIERVSGQPYEDYVTQKILTPLKMERSTFLKENYQKDSDAMTSYFVQEKEGTVEITPADHPFHKFIYGPGGLLSSVKELTHYLTFNMNDGVYEGVQVVDASLLKDMHKPHIERDPGLFGKSAYGYGWGITEDFLGHTLVNHGGSTGMSSAYISFVPDLNIGVVMACNMGGAPALELVSLGMLAFLMGKDPEKDIPVFEIEKKLNMLAGEYESYKGIHKISIMKKGELLYAEIKEKFIEMEAPLIPETENMETFTFYIQGPGVRTPVEFVVDSSGIDLYIERNRFHKMTS